MIARKVGEECAVEVKSGDTFLSDSVAADLHESIFATGIHHPAQQTVQFKRVRRGMGGRNGFVLNIIDDR